MSHKIIGGPNIHCLCKDFINYNQRGKRHFLQVCFFVTQNQTPKGVWILAGPSGDKVIQSLADGNI